MTPSTRSRSSATSSSRTPRVIMNWFAPCRGACGRMLAGLTCARSVMTSRAGDSSVTRADWAGFGRWNPAPAPSSRMGSASYSRSKTRPLALHGERAARAHAAVGLQEAMQLDERLAVYLALEVDDRVERHPVLVPAPRVEFRV